MKDVLQHTCRCGGGLHRQRAPLDKSGAPGLLHRGWYAPCHSLFFCRKPDKDAKDTKDFKDDICPWSP
jgi:hypothetical protein